LEAERYGEALNIAELVSRSSKHVTEREVVVTNEPLPVMVCYTNPVLIGLRLVTGVQLVFRIITLLLDKSVQKVRCRMTMQFKNEANHSP
jgi:hypothetical protein